ncbi:TraB/GumN family protein [Erythrobacter sp. W53]|uniref:TraB/GumN family protein n=1 Tax=Erythrobacter sp. W53 TaxID=3425947 RepID=UPI003D769018
MVLSPYRTAALKFLAILLLAGALTACATARSSEPVSAVEDARTPGPALWTISDEDTTIHLFGFAPVVKPGTDWQSKLISDSLTDANLFVIETDSSSSEAQAAVQSLIPQIGLNTDGRSLSSQLDENERDEIDAISTAIGAPLSALDPLRPWLASVQLGVLAISQGDYDLQNVPSNQLLGLAKDRAIEVRSLEGPADLMQVMARFSEEEQVGMLLHNARSLRDRPDQQAMIADAWLDGDVELIGELLHGEEGAWSSEAIYNAMLVARNEAWLSELENLLKEHEGTAFFTVGLGHFAGPDSLINMLRDKGITTKRR